MIPQDSPCRTCDIEWHCTGKCPKFEEYFRQKWRAIRYDLLMLKLKGGK